MASLSVVAIGLLIIAALSILAARSDEALRSKCKRRESLRRTHQQILSGKCQMR